MTYVSPFRLNWYEDRTKFIREKIEEELNPGTWTARDISASTVKIYLRCWKSPTSDRTISDALLNEQMTKETDGTGGNDAITYCYATITSGAGRVGPLEFEIVLVDEAITSQPTPSTYREIPLKTWGSADGARLHATIQPDS